MSHDQSSFETQPVSGDSFVVTRECTHAIMKSEAQTIYTCWFNICDSFIWGLETIYISHSLEEFEKCLSDVAAQREDCINEQDCESQGCS